MTKVYIVFGSEYNTYYMGSTYSSLEECQQECDFLNTEHQKYREWWDRFELFDQHFDKEYPNYSYEEYKSLRDKREETDPYFSSPTSCFVFPRELNVQDQFKPGNIDCIS